MAQVSAQLLIVAFRALKLGFITPARHCVIIVSFSRPQNIFSATRPTIFNFSLASICDNSVNRRFVIDRTGSALPSHGTKWKR